MAFHRARTACPGASGQRPKSAVSKAGFCLSCRGAANGKLLSPPKVNPLMTHYGMVSRIQPGEHVISTEAAGADSGLTHENPASVFPVITAADDDKPSRHGGQFDCARAARQLNFVCGRCWRTPSR